MPTNHSFPIGLSWLGLVQILPGKTTFDMSTKKCRKDIRKRNGEKNWSKFGKRKQTNKQTTKFGQLPTLENKTIVSDYF